jgi:hypothetical protein
MIPVSPIHKNNKKETKEDIEESKMLFGSLIIAIIISILLAVYSEYANEINVRATIAKAEQQHMIGKGARF